LSGVSCARAVVTKLAYTISIRIKLLRIRIIRTEISLIIDAIAITITFRLIYSTGITDVVLITVNLSSVGGLKAVVTGITHPISILILLTRIGEQRTEIQLIRGSIFISIDKNLRTSIPLTISICIALICVGDIDAVITEIAQTIPIKICLIRI